MRVSVKVFKVLLKSHSTCCVIIYYYLFFLGDTFEKLEDEDEQGWCKGRKDGKVGLYPANYIEVI